MLLRDKDTTPTLKKKICNVLKKKKKSNIYNVTALPTEDMGGANEKVEMASSELTPSSTSK